MFARYVFMHLKPNSAAEFTRTLDQEIIPVLRRLRGVGDPAVGGGRSAPVVFGW